MSHPADVVKVTADVRRARFALPDHRDDAAKGDRGSVLIVGGSGSTAGAVLLAGLGALRAGAGKLQLATVEAAVGPLMTAVPEALVAGLPAGDDAAIDGPAAAAQVAELAVASDAVLLGTGALDPTSTGVLLDAITSAVAGDDACTTTLVLDVAALPPAGEHPEWVRRIGSQVLAVPNPGEVALLCPDADPEQPAEAARVAAAHLGCTVACRGPETWIAEPSGALYVECSGVLGLATSGSGDVAAGIATGLLARGASPVTAAVWTAFLHGAAGERLSRRIGPLGFLARELLDEIPGLLEA